MRERNRFHVWGFVLWGVLLVAAFVLRPDSWGYAALEVVPLLFLAAIGGAVLVSTTLRRR